jgi:hypothetical protein
MTGKTEHDLEDVEEIFEEYEEIDDDIDGFVETSEYEKKQDFSEPEDLENIASSNKRDDIKNHPNVKRIKRKQRILTAFNSATNKIFNLGKSIEKRAKHNRKRGVVSRTTPSRITGIGGSTAGIMSVSGENVRVTGGPPNVSMTYQPNRAQPKTPQVIRGASNNNTALNAALIKPNNSETKYVSRPRLTGNQYSLSFRSPASCGSVVNLNPDWANNVLSGARTRNRPLQRAPKSADGVTDYLTDSVLKPRKQRSKK